MEIDRSAAVEFLSYADGNSSLEEIWAHPAYGIAQKHAELLGESLTREDVSGAMAGEQTTFATGESLEEHREQIDLLLEYVGSHETDWREQIEENLARITPDEDLSEVTLFLGVGYSFGIGLEDGAYADLNEPLFHRMPRQLLYTAIHECSHVLYDRVHRFSSELGPERLDSREGQQMTFNTLFHTEAYATYTPLDLRRADGNVGKQDHVVCEDYRVLSDETRLRQLVEEYDSFREALEEGPVPPQKLFESVFGGPRLPYRVGCALLDGLEKREGLAAVRDAFYVSPAEFVEKYDWVLDEYRT